MLSVGENIMHEKQSSELLSDIDIIKFDIVKLV